MPDHLPKRDAFLRWPDVEARIGLKKSIVHEMIGAGTFPSPYRLSARAIAWKESEIQEWIEARPRVAQVAAQEAA